MGGWFKAHHQNWVKPPSDFDSSAWMLRHTALVNEERESTEQLGYTVSTENQNLFRLRGSSATIAGKPDLIAGKAHEVVVIDAKTGKPGPSHRAKVMIYQYAVPKALQQYQGRRIRPRQVSRLPRNDAGISGETGVHIEPRLTHPETGGRNAIPPRLQRPRVPVLRHQQN